MLTLKPPAPQDETLPAGWTKTALGSTGSLLRGVTYKSEESSKEPRFGLVPVLRANNIDSTLNVDNLVYVPAARVADQQRIKSGDVVIAMSSGSKNLVGKAAQADRDIDAGFGAFCGLYRAVDGIDKRFVGYFFQSPGYRQSVSQLSSGININNLRAEHIESMLLPLAPLPEQRRIVAKLEELFTVLESGLKSLTTARTVLHRYRRALYSAAAAGSLSSDWRIANVQFGVDPNDNLDTAERQRLPSGWEWQTVGSLGVPNEQAVVTGPFGTTLGRGDFAKSGIPVLTIGCLKEQGITLDKAVYVSEAKLGDLARYALREGDLLFSRMASVGRGGIVPAALSGALYNYHIMRLRLDTQRFLPSYYLAYLRGSSVVQDYLRRVNHGATRDGVNTQQLMAMPVALPPIAEQHAIVTELERRLSIIDALELTLNANLKRAERLRQSISQRAFSGRLVPQDPTDEPASELLRRIRLEQAARYAAGTGRRRGRPRKLADQEAML